MDFVSSKFTYKEFLTLYPNDSICLDKFFKWKYRAQKECSKCSKPFKYYKMKTRKVYECGWCGYNICPLADTIFHKSSTSLHSWFLAIFLFTKSKNGIAAKELQRLIGVTYKCAWRMCKQIRSLFNENLDKLKNIVEIDETYVGGKESNKHKDKKTPDNQGRSLKTKSAILGAVQREGNIVAKVVTNTQSSTIKPFVRENICITAQIKTDEYVVYKSVPNMGYSHETVDHGKGEYVNGNVHTNNLEGFWSQLKRSINGTYHFVSPKYLQIYVNEFAYRYNHREDKKPLFFQIILQAL